MKEPTNRLSAELRRLRKEADLSGAAAAKLAGLTQSKVSRTETGAFMPTPDQVEALCRVYKAPPELRRELVQMAHEVREEQIPARAVIKDRVWQLQERIGRIEAIAGRIRSLAPSTIPGIIQTREYIQALFGDELSPSDLERAIGARIATQTLLDTDRAFEFVLAEGALRWNMGGAGVMVKQLDALINTSQRANVRLGVISWTTPVTVPLLHTFTIYDSRAVMYGTQSSTALITEPRDVEQYENHWEEVGSFASFDDEARAIIERTRDDYRSII
ncbi:MAG: helix-turn-helix domain-containing protein [Pseudonocardiaceae bacterium]